MYQQIIKQFDSGKAMAQGKYFSLFRAHLSQISHDIYPYATDYYHELNPYFLFNLPRLELLGFTHAITVRDGFLPFCMTMLSPIQLTRLPNNYIIHPKLAPFVPPHLEDRFCCWTITHPKKVSISKAKTALVLGLMNNESIGSEDLMKRKLSQLKLLNPEANIEVYLPTRKEPTEDYWREHNIGYQAIELIKSFAPKNKITYLTTKELQEKSSFSDTYLIDLYASDMIVLDKGFYHNFVSKGGTVPDWDDKKPLKTFFEFKISFNHSIHISPLPKTTNCYAELLFYKRMNKNRHLMIDKEFHKLIGQLRS